MVSSPEGRREFGVQISLDLSRSVLLLLELPNRFERLVSQRPHKGLVRLDHTIFLTIDLGHTLELGPNSRDLVLTGLEFLLNPLLDRLLSNVELLEVPILLREGLLNLLLHRSNLIKHLLLAKFKISIGEVHAVLEEGRSGVLIDQDSILARELERV